MQPKIIILTTVEMTSHMYVFYWSVSVNVTLAFHYENLDMQYTKIFQVVLNLKKKKNQ